MGISKKMVAILIISGGLGESILPIRFMRPPEIVQVTVEASAFRAV